jgi:FlaG/FlaF family flagellin (archaellin)
LSGTANDSTRATVPAAKIELVNSASGDTRRSVTDSQGDSRTVSNISLKVGSTKTELEAIPEGAAVAPFAI